MSSNLSLPIDIPWRRLCVSEDMLDEQVCDREFPLRWRSSVAVFTYEPDEDYQNYEGMTVSYLKVAFTITGFQPDPDEVGLTDRRAYQAWNDPEVIQNYLNVVGKYYGCYGAILEVAVAPHGGDVPLSDYPYFADFDPKKRELFETVSETGETMSRSLGNVNVRKGGTTINSHEVLDVFEGFSQQFQYAGTGGGHSVSGQWGTKDMTQNEYTNIRTTDQAREERETYSHTTQLSQMYHQLDSYHIGTNRAMFFLLPRPHVIQSTATFVNGPRLLEGIQDVFLVVLRPEGQAPPCVEAYLETAHIAEIPITEHETSTHELSLRVVKEAEDTGGGFGDDSNVTYAEGSESWSPLDGWEIDLDRQGGYRIDRQEGERIEDVVITAEKDNIVLYGKVSAEFNDGTFGNDLNDGRLDLGVTVFIRKKVPKIVGYNSDLWLTGRGVCCCGRDVDFLEPSVLGEGTLVNPLQNAFQLTQPMPISDANALRTEIGRRMIEIKQGASRYPRGAIGFTETAFLGRAIAKVVRQGPHPDNVLAVDLPGVPEDVRRRISEIAPKISRGRLLDMPLQEQADRFGLEYEAARKLRRSAIGLEGPELSPARRWDKPGEKIGVGVKVPNLVGLTANEARRELSRAHLKPGGRETIDGIAPTGTVLEQSPEAGTEAQGGDQVKLRLSSGVTVLIPDVVGMGLPSAICELYKAGLQSEPRLEQARGEGRAGTVLGVEPHSRSYVTPHADVVLYVAGLGGAFRPHVE